MIWGGRSANYITRPYCQSLSIVSRVGHGVGSRRLAQSRPLKRKTPTHRIGVFGVLVVEKLHLKNRHLKAFRGF